MQVLIFAGTTEGREIAVYLAEKKVRVTACVATEYGSMVMPGVEGLEVLTGRLSPEQIAEIIKNYSVVIDATHPYAKIVTENIRSACKKGEVEYLRLLRPSIPAKKVITVQNTPEAAKYLDTVEGNVLLTTGSKELEVFTAVRDFERRLYARVLPSVEAVEKCIKLGFKGKNLICMQGPFSHEMNAALLKQTDAKYLVTKDTGTAGGFEEKISAANETEVTVIMISRPNEFKGYTMQELKTYLNKMLAGS